MVEPAPAERLTEDPLVAELGRLLQASRAQQATIREALTGVLALLDSRRVRP